MTMIRSRDMAMTVVMAMARDWDWGWGFNYYIVTNKTILNIEHIVCCFCLPISLILAIESSPISPSVVLQPASPSICPSVPSLRRVCPQIQG